MNEKPQTSILPTQKNMPKSKVNDYTWLIYGPPGIGKTTLASQFENALILALEPGTKHLETYSIPISCWDDVVKVGTALKKEEHNFKTVVIDTVDLFHRLAIQDLCNRRKIEHPSDEAYGKGSDMVKTAVYSILTSFSGLGLGLVFISHTREKTVKTRTLEYTKTTVSLSDSPASIFIPYCDIVGYCHFDKDTQLKRIITFQGSDYLDAKARTCTETKLPESCELDYNVIKSYFEGEKD